MQIIESPKVYDVIVVGSGAGGGMATHELANAGLKVALLEAGPFFDPKDAETKTQLKWPWESPRRGACFLFYLSSFVFNLALCTTLRFLSIVAVGDER